MRTLIQSISQGLLPEVKGVGINTPNVIGWNPDESSTYCHRCGVTMGFGAITEDGCSQCLNNRFPWDTVYRLGGYEEPLSEWIVQYKFWKIWRWGDWFGEQLAGTIKPYGKSVVVPIPLHWTRQLSRGFDQAALIARRIARQNNIRYAKLLKRVKRTAPQTTLGSKSLREANVRRAFKGKNVNLNGWTVYMVDDVKTTGSTARQCARILRKMGADSIHLVVVGVADTKTKTGKDTIPL